MINTELEYKFTLKEDCKDLPMEQIFNGDAISIVQGYISHSKKKHVRIRSTTVKNQTSYELTVKVFKTLNDRVETSIVLSEDEFYELYKTCNEIIIKTRFMLKPIEELGEGGYELILDVYADGTAILELEITELESKKGIYDTVFKKYAKKDVTGKKKYSNFTIAKRLKNENKTK